MIILIGAVVLLIMILIYLCFVIGDDEDET